MNAVEAMNHIARAIEEAMGEPVNSQEGASPRGPWLPLSVRYAAAEAAVRVVVEWKNEPFTCDSCGKTVAEHGPTLNCPRPSGAGTP